MTYQPMIPASGNVGWAFLQNTRQAQQRAFDGSVTITRDVEYFRENIGKVRDAGALVQDYRLLKVALGAFGLQEDIGNRFYIRKVLEEGTIADDAFSNRLADKRYQALAKAFAFDLEPPNTSLNEFPEKIITKYKELQFEVAVGEQDESLRLALGVGRELDMLKQRNLGETAAWFTIMGTPPLRRVFEFALGLPPQTGAIDIERQLKLFRDKSVQTFGTSNPIDLSSDDARENLIRRFLFRAEIANNSASTSRASIALSLLQTQQSLL